MAHFHIGAPAAVALTASFLFISPAHAEECEKPTSAGDILGNLKSFGCNLGKGVKIDPQRPVVASGYLDGKGQGVCYGDKSTDLPVVLKPVPDGKLTIAIVPCSELIATGAFQRVAPGAANSTVTGGKPVATDQPTIIGCRGQIPIRDGTGDMWCIINGRIDARVHREPTGVPGYYTTTLLPLKPGEGGGAAAAPGHAVDWDAMKRKNAADIAALEARMAQDDAARAARAEARRAAVEKCLGLKDAAPAAPGDKAQPDAMHKCMASARQ